MLKSILEDEHPPLVMWILTSQLALYDLLVAITPRRKILVLMENPRQVNALTWMIFQKNNEKPSLKQAKPWN